MNVAELEQRPPYIRFEQRAVEDRDKTQETGIYSYKDVEMVLVTPHGSKDVHEDLAENWLAKQAELARKGRIPQAHYDYFRRTYDNWREGLEEPLEGTPIKGWPAISPAQQEQVYQANLRTVEDLAQAPEQALHAIGMGARALKQKAQAWLESSDTGRAANRIQDLENKLADAEERNQKQAQMIDELSSRLERLESGGKKTASKKKSASKGR